MKKQLSEQQINGYREKLNDRKYMEKAVCIVAEKILRVSVSAGIPDVKLNKNITEERKMKNKAIDLHNHLFEQLERLNDTSIKGNDLNEEIRRAEAMNKVAMAIIANGRMVIDAHKMAEDIGMEKMPDMLADGTEPKQIISRK